MKENEELGNINELNNNIINNPDKDGMIDRYNKTESISEKLEFLIDSKIYLDSKNQTSLKKVPLKDFSTRNELESDFIERYIVNGTEENIKQVFNTLGNLMGENIERTYYEQKNFQSEFKKDDRLAERKAYWLARQSNSGKYNDAISTLLRKCKEGLVNHKEPANILFEGSGITNNHTMEDFYKSAGYTKGEITSLLQKRGIPAKTKVGVFFENEYPDRNGKALKEIMAQEFANLKAQTLAANGSREYFTVNKPYESIKSELEKINQKSKLPAPEDRIENWVQETGKKQIKSINKAVYRDADLKYQNKYRFRSYKKESVAEKQIYEAREKYKSFSSMEEKFDYLVSLNAMITSKADVNAGVSDKQYLFPTTLTKEEFTKEFTNSGNISSVKDFYVLWGKKSAETILNFQKDRDEFLKEFPENDETRMYKADYLASHSFSSGSMKASLAGIAQYVTTYSSNMIDTVWNAAKINFPITIKDFLKKAGYKGDELNSFLENNQIDPQTDAETYFTNKANEMDKDPMEFMKGEFFSYTTNLWKMAGQNKVLAAHKIKGEKLEKFERDGKILTEEPKESKITNWLAESGVKRVDGFIKNAHAEIVNEHNKKYVGGKTYDQYIRLHCGPDVTKMSLKDKQEYLAKNIAASILKSTEKDLDVDKIHKYVKTVKALPGYKAIASDPTKLDYYLSGEGRIPEAKYETMKGISEVNENQVEAYVEAMKKLQENMMTSVKRSEKYKDFHKAVDAIANLSGKYDFALQADRLAASRELVDLNTTLLNNTIKYITDKETVRTYDDGKERFHNALDALGIMNAHIPNAKTNVDAIVNKINTKRHAEPGQAKYVDISKYGADRAAEAKIARDLKNSNQKAPVANAVQPK